MIPADMLQALGCKVTGETLARELDEYLAQYERRCTSCRDVVVGEREMCAICRAGGGR